MPPSSPADPEQRLQSLIREVEATRRSAPLQSTGSEPSRPLRLGRSAWMTVPAVLLALWIGVQLGALPWRYRRELWQAQGIAVGVVVGFAIGRLTSRRTEDS
jgi:hypothetical protein